MSRFLSIPLFFCFFCFKFAHTYPLIRPSPIRPSSWFIKRGNETKQMQQIHNHAEEQIKEIQEAAKITKGECEASFVSIVNDMDEN